MKSYKEFQEAISAQRLAQLKAKGKGDAAAAKMKVDGLKPQKQENARRIKQGNAPQGNVKGGALAVRPQPKSGGLAVSPKRAMRDKAVRMAGDFVKRKAGEVAKDQAGKLAIRAKDKAGKLVRTNNKPEAKEQPPYKKQQKAGGGYMGTPEKHTPADKRKSLRNQSLKNVGKFMGKGIKRALKSKGQTGIASSSLKGSGTQNWGASMR